MGAGYKYPLYPWNREWSQYYIYQWHLTEYGPPYYLGFRFGPPSVKKTLGQIKKIDAVTRGIPKVILLCGWQKFVEGKVTWDTQFPSFVTTSDEFADDSIGAATGAGAVRWLMAEAKKYNTLVSFHLDFALAQQHSALWQQYRDLDLLCKNEKGEIKSYGHWEGRVNLQKEFDAGLFQKRMADFFDTFPEVLETGCVHNDWNCADDSPWHRYTREDDAAALRRNMAWIKQAYGVDTCAELVATGRPGYDYGMQFLALSFNRQDSIQADRTKVPAYIFCGGHGGRQDGEDAKNYTPGALLYPDEVLLAGASNQGEFGYNYTNDENDPGYENNLFRDFCYSTLPWYYLNRLLRLSFGPDCITFSDGVKSFIDGAGKVCITKDGYHIRRGNDIFIPEPWKTNREIMAWSDEGYKNQKWKLPASWSDVSAADLYGNTLEGLRLRERGVKTGGAGFLTLSLAARDGVVIVPAGADPCDAGAPPPPSGAAEYIGQDKKTSYPENIPGYAKVGFIAGEAGLHAIIDVDVGENCQNVALLFTGENPNCRCVLDVIDANSIQRLGNENTKLLNDFAGGIYVTYKITGHVRFRATRFHYDGFGRGNGENEAELPLFSGLFFGAGNPGSK